MCVDTGMDEQPSRVWIDERNAIFRCGLASCVVAGGFTLAGESGGLVPPPDPAELDILVFDLDGTSLPLALRLVHGNPVRLVGIARSAPAELRPEALVAGLSGIVARSGLTPDGLITVLRAVACGNAAIAPSLLARMLGAATGAQRSEPGRAGRLSNREVAVLRLLADGASTRHIAIELRYSERTVKNIVHDTLAKLNCTTRAQAVACAVRQGAIG
jgi:DNA-binding NarL/FixJ family response regulator